MDLVVVGIAFFVIGAGVATFIFRAQVKKANVERDGRYTESRVLQAQLDGAKAGVSEHQSTIDQLRRDLLSAANEREAAVAIHKRSDIEAMAAKNEAIELRARVDAAERVRADSNAELQVTKAQLQREQALNATDRDALTKRESEIKEKDGLLIRSAADLAATVKERDGLRSQLDSQKAWVEEQKTGFENAVLSAAMKLMEERGRAFTETNKKEIDTIIAPFKDQLRDFRTRIDEIHSTDAKDRGVLHEQISNLASIHRVASEQTDRLVNALTISSKSTGDWGETILTRILEDSGLREGKEYVLQKSVDGEDGARLRPDAIILLPEQRQLVVDSKVSNKAWTAYCGEKNEDLKASCLETHVESVRNHVKSLANRDYSGVAELRGVDFVLMFVPVEAALLTALSHDPQLYTDSYRAKVILVAPSTLMAVIKLVEGIWTFQKRKESVDEIADAGKKLFEKLTTFANSFVEVGNSIGKSREAYERAQGQLATGRGNAIRLAARMVELGVSPAPGKTMPAVLTAKMDDGDDEADDNEAASPAMIGGEKLVAEPSKEAGLND
jgi:DNA recombination protein RmuC